MIKRIFSEEETLIIQQLYQREGKTQEEIGKLFNCSKKVIHRILKENNIPTNIRRVNRLLDENYFSIINSENKAYLLGLLFADGNVTKDKSRQAMVRLQLLKEDINLLELFQKEVKSNGALSYNSDGTYTFSIRSNKIAADLEKYNIIPNKTYNIHELPKNIPNEYYKDFLRGLIDGDGSLYFSGINYSFHLSLTSHYTDLIEDYINIIYKILGIPNRAKERKPTFYNNTAKFTLNSIEAYTLAKILYENASVYCKRKYNKFLEAKKKYEI